MTQTSSPPRAARRALRLPAGTVATAFVDDSNNVETTGLAVEHFQQYETIWNGQGGTDIFFQNENPYEVPSQAAWMSSATLDGYPAFYLPSSVTAATGYGMASYSYFDQGVSINGAGAAVSPNNGGPSDVVSAS
jgi:hypothetical protein